jgi:hypothetical protein
LQLNAVLLSGERPDDGDRTRTVEPRGVERNP